MSHAGCPALAEHDSPATAGLKPTQDRFPTDGVVGLTLTMDVAGPLARDVTGVLLGTTWMEPGFEVAAAPATRIGRLRVGEVEPHIDAAVDAALARAADQTGAEIVELSLDRLASWRDACNAGGIRLVGEGWQQHGHLLERNPHGFSQAAEDKLRVGSHVDGDKRAFVADTQ